MATTGLARLASYSFTLGAFALKASAHGDVNKTGPMASAPTTGAMAHNATAGNAIAGNATAGHQIATGPGSPIMVNWYLIVCMVWAWIAVCGSLAIYVFLLWLVRYIRQVSCLNNDQQRYFSLPNKYYGIAQRYFIDAPLFRTRHHREFRLSRALNVGTLPSRAQMLFLIAYLAMNITILCYNLPWSGPRAATLAALTSRSGALILANMFPLFLLAARNNPLIPFTGITFDTYNLIHRWLGRIVALHIVVHATTYLMKKIALVGWSGFAHSLQSSRFILAGTIVSNLTKSN
jgi:hypothetical protein